MIPSLILATKASLLLTNSPAGPDNFRHPRNVIYFARGIRTSSSSSLKTHAKIMRNWAAAYDHRAAYIDRAGIPRTKRWWQDNGGFDPKHRPEEALDLLMNRQIDGRTYYAPGTRTSDPEDLRRAADRLRHYADKFEQRARMLARDEEVEVWESDTNKAWGPEIFAHQPITDELPSDWIFTY